MRSFGRYETRAVLCRGTTPLLLCHDPLVGRNVVVRTLCHTLALDPERRSRFLDSAARAARLSSPHVAAVLDLGHAQGDPYVVMELPEGASLRKVMDGSQPPEAGVRLDVISQLCDALADAHAHGVLQLGLRPTGIFVTESGYVTVVPFGIIPIHGSRGTIAALSLEELAYLAPELVEGLVADRRADIFSLGVIAFELMTRRRPFRADNIPALLHALVSERPALAPDEKDLLGPALAGLVMKALARDPLDRYSDAGIMLVELADLSCSRPECSFPNLEGTPDGTWRSARQPGAGSAAEREGHAFEIEVLRASALSSAADGDFDAAEVLAEKIEAAEPGDPRNDLLRTYLREERTVRTLLATARREMAAGRLREARTAAVQALTFDPPRASARALLCHIDRVLSRAKRRLPSAVSGGG